MFVLSTNDIYQGERTDSFEGLRNANEMHRHDGGGGKGSRSVPSSSGRDFLVFHAIAQRKQQQRAMEHNECSLSFADDNRCICSLNEDNREAHSKSFGFRKKYS